MENSEIRPAFGDSEHSEKKKNWYQKFNMQHLSLCLGLVSITFFFYLLGSGCYFAALILVLWAVVVMLMYFHFFQSKTSDDFDYYGKPRTFKSKLLRVLSKNILKNDAYQPIDEFQSKANRDGSPNADSRGKHGRTYAKIKNERYGKKYRTNPRSHSSGVNEFKEIINDKPIHIHLPETVHKSRVRVNEKDCIEITNLNKGAERIYSTNDRYYIKDKKRKYKHPRSPDASTHHKRHYYDHHDEFPTQYSYDRPKHIQKYPRSRQSESPKLYKKYETDMMPTRDLGSHSIKPDEYMYNNRVQPYSSHRLYEDGEQDTRPTRDIDSAIQNGNVENATISPQQLPSRAVTEPEDKNTNQKGEMYSQQDKSEPQRLVVKDPSSSESNKLKKKTKKESKRGKNKKLKKTMSDEVSRSKSKIKKCKICCKTPIKKTAKAESDESDVCWEILPRIKSSLRSLSNCSKKSSKSSKTSTRSNVSSYPSSIQNPPMGGYYPQSTSQVCMCTSQQTYDPYRLPPHFIPPPSDPNNYSGNSFLIEELEKLRNEIIVRKECICSKKQRGEIEECNMKQQNQRLISLLRDIIDENSICQCPNIQTELKALEQQMSKDCCAAMNTEIQSLLQKLNTKCAVKCASGFKEEKKVCKSSESCIKEKRRSSSRSRKRRSRSKKRRSRSKKRRSRSKKRSKSRKKSRCKSSTSLCSSKGSRRSRRRSKRRRKLEKCDCGEDEVTSTSVTPSVLSICKTTKIKKKSKKQKKKKNKPPDLWDKWDDSKSSKLCCQKKVRYYDPLKEM